MTACSLVRVVLIFLKPFKMNEEDEDKKKKKKNFEKKKKRFGKCFDKKKRKNPKIDSFVPSPSNASIV